MKQIGKAIDELSQSITRSDKKMQQSIESISATQTSTSTIGMETSRFGEKLQQSLERFRQVDESSGKVKNEIQELATLGSTFTHLMELMVVQGVLDDSIDPLQRLLPLVEQSSYKAANRFTAVEKEYILQQDDILVSATDARGVITFANNCFCRIAEYKLEEIVGKPHNIIRHPDMPKTAFADLWAVIKGGKLWQGYVLNRSKGGRAYWVKACVFPCFENGQIVGYISVRTQPNHEKISQAIEAYRLIP